MLILLYIQSNGVWNIIPGIETAISLIAFALAVTLAMMLAWFKSKRRIIPTSLWVMLILLVLLGVVSTIYKPSTNSSDIYRVRVSVVDPQGIPIEDAEVWSSFGGEPKKIAGGWQFDIPAASKPTDARLIIFASRESAFLSGNANIMLSRDYNLAVTIKLRRDLSAKVRGQVIDGRNRPIVGARVFVVGYEVEAVITKEGGNFELPAHAAVNQQILLRAEKSGFRVAQLWHPAGDHPALLVLER